MLTYQVLPLSLLTRSDKEYLIIRINLYIYTIIYIVTLLFIYSILLYNTKN